MKIKQNAIRKPTIDLIPLLDSMFLILLFFIFATMSMVMHNGIPMDLPNARTGKHNQSKFLTLSISKDGSLYLEKERYSLDDLKLKLAELKETNQLPHLYIASDKRAEFGLVLNVLDACRDLEIDQIAFETRKQ